MFIKDKNINDNLTHVIMPSFEKRMQRHLATHYSHALLSNNIKLDDLELFVKTGLQKAKVYGVSNKTEVQCFLEYLATYGLEVESENNRSWLQNMFKRDDICRLQKIREIKLRANAEKYN